ncbi:YbaB/EbfC family nucleoid-associated protein [Asanoa sp. WMMD1127]|uniref:YbaB/EbfC family nucleoid-associated protein n=1 Tax=Asanoa sp. WMMD1127 TaxID=3016107 RepID=UPI002416DF07|nr:YbaB/EbfC family nucleoid-associated protein [Asanoa sp. WMMD1127]MDG4825640.1 YbaB/EbfC family nucleoid-associated protein [Asanoa sp. WMMD1127]
MDDARLEDLDRSIRETEQRMRGLGDLQRTLAETTAAFTTERGLVTVEIGADQALRGLEIHPTALRLTPQELAAEIMTAHAGAREALATSVNAALAGVLGTDSPTDVLRDAAKLEDTMTETLGELSRSMNDAIVAVSRLQSRS